MARQVFTKAFKLEAVRLLDAGKQPAAAIARELGIKREKLYAWREQLREKGPDAFHDRPGRPAADEGAEIRRLKRELERVTEERDILKNVWPAPSARMKFGWPRRSASTYPVSGLPPGQDGDPRDPGLTSTSAMVAIFLTRLPGRRD